MVSNLKKITIEIRDSARRVVREQDYTLDAKMAEALVMRVVDLEDQNRIKKVARINQLIIEMIRDAAQTANSQEED